MKLTTSVIVFIANIQLSVAFVSNGFGSGVFGIRESQTTLEAKKNGEN